MRTAIDSSIQPYLHIAANSLAAFLEKHLKQEGESNWWQTRVVSELTYGQQGQVRARGITGLGQLDLAALLRVFERNWYSLQDSAELAQEARTLAREVTDLRHADAHAAAVVEGGSWQDTYRSLDTLERFVVAIEAGNEVVDEIRTRRLEALAALAIESFPKNDKGPEELVTTASIDPHPIDDEAAMPQLGSPAISSDSETSAAGADTPRKLSSRAIGKFRLYGPENSIETEVAAFDGRAVAATEIPWKVTGPAGLELKIHVILIDDPDEGREIGQVFCDSRLGSPQSWDEIVRRLRSGIWIAGEGILRMDLRAAVPKQGNRASRRVLRLEELDTRAGFNVADELLRLGARGVGSRGDIAGDSNPRTKNWLCVTFDHDDLLTPVAAWVATTVASLAWMR
jgi:hypothetical protein